MLLKFHWPRTLLIITAVSLLSLTFSTQASAAKPGYEPVFYNGGVYAVNIIEVPNVASSQAIADFYQVVYPIGWQSLGIGTPQCNPCDHDGGGIDFIDYHDHVLDSIPRVPVMANSRRCGRSLWCLQITQAMPRTMHRSMLRTRRTSQPNPKPRSRIC
jgi:hypothetical protein